MLLNYKIFSKTSITLVVLWLCILCSSLYAQTSKDSTLLVYSFKKDQGLRLKWLPASITQFELGIANGYNIYRAKVIASNGKAILGNYEKVNDQAIMPWPQLRIDGQIAKDSSFELVKGYLDYAKTYQQKPVPATVEGALEQQKQVEYFSFFSALAILQTNLQAEALGYFYTDKQQTSTTGEFMYKVEMVNHPNYVTYALVDLAKANNNTQIANFTASLSTKYVSLKWFNNQSKDYVAYNLYRSEKKDGPFQKINDIPFMNSGSETSKDKNYSYYSDSILDYGKTYYYKIAGLNPFGEEGPSTPVQEVKAYRKLSLGVFVEDGKDKGMGIVELNWQYNTEEKPYIKEVNVFRANNPDGPFKKLNSKPLSNKVTTFLDLSPKGSSNYYQISVYGYGGDSIPSLLKSVLLIDSISPAMPEIDTITCDTNGIVNIKWLANKEPDLLGYRLFKTYDRSNDPERVNRDLWPDSSYQDTLNLKEGYNKIFYRLFALDGHYNPSKPSEYYTLVLPDKFAPSSGYFITYEVKFDGIYLKWQKPADKDLKTLTLLRKSDLDFDYVPLKTLAGDSLQRMTYLDTNVKANLRYSYCLQAQDEAGLRSPLSTPPLYLEMINNTKIASVKNLTAIVNRENRLVKLNWELNANAIGYQLLRAERGKKLENYTYIDGNVREYYDKWVSPNTQYTYQLVADLENGFTSGPSTQLVIKY
jgi:uncharacterized protein